MTIRDQEDLLIAEFRDLGDWFSQYEYLLEFAAQLPHLDSEIRTDSHRIPGCQSRVWLWLHRTPQDLIQIQADSNSLILKGILCLFVILFDNRLRCRDRTASFYFNRTGRTKRVALNRPLSRNPIRHTYHSGLCQRRFLASQQMKLPGGRFEYRSPGIDYSPQFFQKESASFDVEPWASRIYCKCFSMALYAADASDARIACAISICCCIKICRFFSPWSFVSR